MRAIAGSILLLALVGLASPNQALAQGRGLGGPPNGLGGIGGTLGMGPKAANPGGSAPSSSTNPTAPSFGAGVPGVSGQSTPGPVGTLGSSSRAPATSSAGVSMPGIFAPGGSRPVAGAGEPSPEDAEKWDRLEKLFTEVNRDLEPKLRICRGC